MVQGLLGGKFGEMSTFMNYTYQSFNFLKPSGEAAEDRRDRGQVAREGEGDGDGVMET